jgi:ribosome-associated protein
MTRTGVLRIDPGDVRFEFIRASGPGGQNVNKVATAARLRFDVRGGARSAVRSRTGSRGWPEAGMTSGGELVIEARRFRTQEHNRQDAWERLSQLIERASTPPRSRHATRPPAGAVEHRLRAKQRRPVIKRLRGRTQVDHD